jgi:hypothetical protein
MWHVNPAYEVRTPQIALNPHTWSSQVVGLLTYQHLLYLIWTRPPLFQLGLLDPALREIRTLNNRFLWY